MAGKGARPSEAFGCRGPHTLLGDRTAPRCYIGTHPATDDNVDGGRPKGPSVRNGVVGHTETAPRLLPRGWTRPSICYAVTSVTDDW